MSTQNHRSRRPLRIAVLADLAETMPPPTYGGIQRVCWHLVEHLVARGHEVTVLGCADSRTSARLIACAPHGVWHRSGLDYERDTIRQLVELCARIDRFDVVHSHVDYFTAPIQALAGCDLPPIITTVHGRMDRSEVQASFRQMRPGSLVAISKAQRDSAPDLPWGPVIYHGLPIREMPWRADKEGFLLFVGRLHPEKGVLEAIDIARAAGRPLIIAGWVGGFEREWFEHSVQPRLGLDATYVGPVDEAAKRDLMARASALLFPIRWPEPFGLVMIEALACGTPVAAVRLGSVPEILDDGLTAILADDPESLAQRIDRLETLDPATCRQAAEQRFTVERMVDEYEHLLTDRVLSHGQGTA